MASAGVIESSDTTSIMSNGGVVYPLLIAAGILVYTIFEKRQELYAYYCAFGSYRLARDAVVSATALVLTGLAVKLADTSPSSILTVGACFTLLAVGCLSFKRRDLGADAAAGASPVSLVMVALSLLIRLTCTLRVSAYLPDDHTGDFLYQLVEGLTLVVALREYLLWQDRPESLQVSPGAFTAGAALVLGAASAASQCYGDLASRPLTDQAYAASVYIETGAWLLQALAMLSMTRDQVNFAYLLPATCGVLCRAYFWDLAAAEIVPRTPVLLMGFFPTALVGCHAAMTGLSAGSCLLGLLKRLAPQRPAAPAPAPAVAVQPAPVPEERVQPPAVAEHLQQYAPAYAAQPKHPYLEDPVRPAQKLAPQQLPCFPELREPLPAGCTQFVPVSSIYENGELVVKFRPM